MNQSACLQIIPQIGGGRIQPDAPQEGQATPPGCVEHPVRRSEPARRLARGEDTIEDIMGDPRLEPHDPRLILQHGVREGREVVGPKHPLVVVQCLG